MPLGLARDSMMALLEDREALAHDRYPKLHQFVAGARPKFEDRILLEARHGRLQSG